MPRLRLAPTSALQSVASLQPTAICEPGAQPLLLLNDPWGDGQPKLHSVARGEDNTLTIKGGADLNRMLPALAAYMGLVGLTATERYMALTPERFRKELSKLSPG